jgi:hypothetical protein
VDFVFYIEDVLRDKRDSRVLGRKGSWRRDWMGWWDRNGNLDA